MGIREVELIHDNSKSNIRPEFHDDSKPNGVIGIWEAVKGYGNREQYYVNFHENPIAHFKKTGEAPLGYVVKKDVVLFEGAVISTHTEDRQFMSDVYGTAWVAVVWDGKKVVNYTYNTDMGYNDCYWSYVNIDATAEVLEKYAEFMEAERIAAAIYKQKELARARARVREGEIKRAKEVKGAIVEIIRGKNKPKKGDDRVFGIVTAVSKQYNTIGVALTKQKGDVTKNGKTYRNVYLDVVWVKPEQLQLPWENENIEIGQIAAKSAWENDKEIPLVLSDLSDNAENLRICVAKIETELNARAEGDVFADKFIAERNALLTDVVRKTVKLW